MNIKRLETFLSAMYLNEDTMRVECNFCSHDDYVFSRETILESGGSFEGLAEPAINHLRKHHANEAIVPEVTDEEVAAAIGSIKSSIKEAK